MDIEEWGKLYKRKTGDDLLHLLRKDAVVLFDPEHGVMAYAVDGPFLHISQLVGDGRYWEQVIEKVAHTSGCTRIRMYTRRNPQCFERKFGYKQVGYVMEKEV